MCPTLAEDTLQSGFLSKEIGVDQERALGVGKFKGLEGGRESASERASQELEGLPCSL